MPKLDLWTRGAHQNYFDTEVPRYLSEGHSKKYILLFGIDNSYSPFSSSEEYKFEEYFFETEEEARNFLKNNNQTRNLNPDEYLIRKIPKTLEKHLDQTDPHRIAIREYKLIKRLEEKTKKKLKIGKQDIFESIQH